MWIQTKITILIFLKTMIVLRVSVSVPEIMSISWIDYNKIIMLLVLVYVMFTIWWDIKQVLMSCSLVVYFCFVIILITFLWELSGAKERISLLIEGKHFYKLNPYIFYLLSYPVAQLVKISLQYRRPWFNSCGRKIPGEWVGYPFQYSCASLVAQMVKNLPAMWEIWVQSLGWEDPLEKRTATHSSEI